MAQNPIKSIIQKIQKAAANVATLPLAILFSLLFPLIFLGIPVAVVSLIASKVAGTDVWILVFLILFISAALGEVAYNAKEVYKTTPRSIRVKKTVITAAKGLLGLVIFAALCLGALLLLMYLGSPETFSSV